MHLRSSLVVLVLASAALLDLGCSPTPDGSGSGGGASVGGTPSGGAASGGAGTGGATGGSASGGAANGGSAVGGATGGETAAGGAAIGGQLGVGGLPTGGADGSGGATAETAEVVNESGTVTFTWSDKKLVIEGGAGARVTSFTQGTQELLFPKASNPSNYGSTFWTSPQTDWNWPPVEAIDSGAYTTSVDAAEGSAHFVSGSATVGSKMVTIEKHFSVDTAHDVVAIEYIIKNTGTATSIAPWEITRVRQGGLTFYKTGSTDWVPEGKQPLTLTKSGGYTWFQGSASTAEGKVSADAGEGWLASADPTSKLLLIKSFTNFEIAEAADDSGEVEIYSSPPSPDPGGVPYVEVENQGKFTAVAQGASFSYEVKWLLRTVPAEVSIAAGSTALADMVLAELEAAGL